MRLWGVYVFVCVCVWGGGYANAWGTLLCIAIETSRAHLDVLPERLVLICRPCRRTEDVLGAFLPVTIEVALRHG